MKAIRYLTLGLLVLASQAHAQTANFDPATSILTLRSVSVGSDTYTNARVQLGTDGRWTILAIDSPTSSSRAAEASYDPATGVLTVPSVAIGTVAYGNARVRLGADGRWALLAADGPPSGSFYNPVALVKDKILFTATRSTDPRAPMKIWTINPDGTGLTEFTSDSEYQSPDVKSNGSGGWKVAWDRQYTTLGVYDSTTRQMTVLTTRSAHRVNISRDATRIAFQAFLPQYQPGPGQQANGGIEIYVASLSGDTTAVPITNVLPPYSGAEWPYFLPSGNRIMYFTDGGTPPGRRLINPDGSADSAVPPPGGTTPSHACFNADGTEFLQAQKLTSYTLATGAVGTLNDLKSTTTLISQLASLGYREVPSSQVPGQGTQGTFALSVDWARDGRRIVFDALVADAGGTIKGVAIFVWDIAAATLTLLNPPEPLFSGRNNNYNYSLATPRWIP